MHGYANLVYLVIFPIFKSEIADIVPEALMCVCLSAETETKYLKINMPDNKQRCNNCKNRHLPQTGKNVSTKSTQSDEESTQGLRDAVVASNSLATDQENLGGQQIQLQILEQLKQMSQRLDMRRTKWQLHHSKQSRCQLLEQQ